MHLSSRSNQNGQTVGYMSVRSPASRQDIAQAEAFYQKLGKDGVIPAKARSVMSVFSQRILAMLVYTRADCSGRPGWSLPPPSGR